MMKCQIKNNPKLKSKQEGVTLMAVMTFLVLMTVVTVSATKISILDVLISGNDQQRVVGYNAAENSLAQHTKTNVLNDAIAADGFNNAHNQYETTDSTDSLSKRVTDLSVKYLCRREGRGSSIGGGAPPCKLYDFQIIMNQKNTGVREDHHKGGGKMVPQAGSKSSLI